MKSRGIFFVFNATSTFVRDSFFLYLLLFLVLLFVSACGSVRKNELTDIVSEQKMTDVRTESNHDVFQDDLQITTSDCTYWEFVKIDYDISSNFSEENGAKIRSKICVKGHRDREAALSRQENLETSCQKELNVSENEVVRSSYQKESTRKRANWYWPLLCVPIVIMISVYLFRRFYK